MAYYCRDCSYKGSKRSADGFCPACGSTAFRLQKNKKGDEQEKRKGPMVLLVLLWGYLIAHVYWKLYG